MTDTPATWLADALFERYSNRLWDVEVLSQGQDQFALPDRFALIRVMTLGSPAKSEDGFLSQNVMVSTFSVPENRLRVSRNDLISDTEGHVKSRFRTMESGTAHKLLTAGPSRVTKLPGGVKCATDHWRIDGYLTSSK